MPFVFEALVGHLYIVGGRSISASPPGALVEVAPKKAARGRETDTFFALVLPSSDSPAPTAFYDQLAQLAAERFFSSSGSVTAGLRDVFGTLNQNLVDHNQTSGKSYEANMICGVLRGQDLIVGRIGGAAAFVQHEGQIVTFPEDLSNDEALYSEPLGVLPVPNVKMTQYRVNNGTRVVFGSSEIADLDTEKIGNALLSRDLGLALVGLKDLARLQLTALAFEFVPPDAPSPEAVVPEGQSTKAIEERHRKERRTTQEMQAQPDHKPASAEVQRRAKRGIGHAALRLAGSLNILNRILNHFIGKKEGGRRWMSSPVSAGMTLLLPAAVVGLVVMLWLSGTGETEFELCVQEAQNRAELARGIANNDSLTVIDAWQLTLEKINECEKFRIGDPGMDALRREAQIEIDGRNQIKRRESRVIASFPQAILTKIVIQGQTLYVLDSANGQVYQVTLADDGLSSIQTSPISEMRRGGTASGIAVGNIFDISYNANDNTIIALDEGGVLITCQPRFLQCQGERLLGTENWATPISMTTWSGRLYILDPGIGEGQIWRYESSGGAYRNAPGEVFGGNRPPLRLAVDVDIDGRGNIYTITSEGNIQKWFSGEAQTFQYAAFPEGQTLTSADSMFLDDTVTSQSVYIVSQPRRMIYETSLIGTFENSFTIFQDNLFQLIEAVVVGQGSGGREIIYAVSGNTIFAFEKG